MRLILVDFFTVSLGKTIYILFFFLSHFRLNRSIGFSSALDLRMSTTKMPTTSSKIFMILSPAKTMDFNSSSLPPAVASVATTQPDCCPSITKRVATAMQKLSTSQVKAKLKISDKLARSTVDAWKDFGSTETQRKPCIFTYSGAAYQGLEASTSCNAPHALAYLQDRLRILSAAYGVLRPMDEIQAYRLEMGTKDILEKDKKMSDIWSTAVTESLVREIKSSSSSSNAVLLNLASDEYAVTVQDPTSTIVIIKVIFRESSGRVVTIYAKRARGLMVRYLAENQVDSIEGVKAFDIEGYCYDPEASEEDDSILVFQRKEESSKKKKADSKAKAPRKKRARTTT